MSRSLHIISSDVPYPPDYGGMIDVFYAIKHLSELGIKIYLHCFVYDRPASEELNRYCEKVYYYTRKQGMKGVSLKHPYMLYSRRDEALLTNLLKNDAPILFEGVHVTYLLDHPKLKGRLKIIRNQNVEQEYYAAFIKREKNILKRIYFYIESKLLQKKEANLSAANYFLTVTRYDHLFFKQRYPQHQHIYVPSFHANNKVTSLTGNSDYALYHGNLMHPENVEAAVFLLEQIIPHSNEKFILAGKSPHPKIIALAEKLENCTVIANPDKAEMDSLIQQAQVIVLPTFQATGLKLKLLYSLFLGRNVLVNPAMLQGTDLDSLCNIANTPQEFIDTIGQLMQQPFSAKEIEERSTLLEKNYSNVKNAEVIKSILLPH